MSAAGFRPVRVIAEPVQRIERDELPSGLRRYRAADGFEAFVAEDVVARMAHVARAAAPDEAIALLVGRICTDARGRFVHVTGFVPDPEAVATRSTVRTSHASELRMRSLARLVFPDSVPLGWFHTHPGYGTTFSPVDRENQATWSEPHALGIVADPTRAEVIGVYRGPRSERLIEATVPSNLLDAEPRAPAPERRWSTRDGRRGSSRIRRVLRTVRDIFKLAVVTAGAFFLVRASKQVVTQLDRLIALAEKVAVARDIAARPPPAKTSSPPVVVPPAEVPNDAGSADARQDR